tara:strand:- start:3315 stop:4055 length:741 start_codon:yes stop_codon:yes gene_type:complete
MDRLENLTLEGGLTPEQLAAMGIIRKIAASLLGSALEEVIVQDYKDGKTQLEIAREYLPEQCEISEDVAKGSISYVIQDTKLLTDLEKRELAHQHIISSGKIKGRRTYELGIGVHGRTKEEMSEDGRQGGKKGGSRSGKEAYELRRGIHGMSKGEKSELGKKTAILRGHTPYYSLPFREDFVEGTEIFIPEIAYAHNLSLDREYRNGSKIKPQKIAEKLNEVYHNGVEVRNGTTLSKTLYKFRKTL